MPEETESKQEQDWRYRPCMYMYFCMYDKFKEMSLKESEDHKTKILRKY